MAGHLLVDYDAVETLEPRFARLTLDNAPLEKLADGFRWLEGLVWMGDWDALLFQDLPSDRTMMWREGGGVEVWRQPSHFANGQARDRQGRLLSCSHRLRAILRTEYDGALTTLVDRCEGRRLNASNDIVVAADGAIWFTDPLYGISNDYEGGIQSSERGPALYRYDGARDRLTLAASDFDGPNGLAFSPDGKRLYVAETGDQTQPDPAHFIRAFDVGADGGLRGGEIFHRISPGYCDGLKVDQQGHIWSSAADGVHCMTPLGELIGKIRIPYRVSNLCFGGRMRNRLFIGGSHTLYAIFLTRAERSITEDEHMRIERLRLLSRDPAELGDFYGAAFGARRTDFGVALGRELIEIVATTSPAQGDFLANETGFQHFAIVVPDIDAAYARLCEVGGWRPISLGGPERLPQASGGAAAFKFRDPGGHPLELLQFPETNVPAEWRRRFEAAPACLFQGIDHTGLTVRDAGASIAFYTGAGFVCGGRQVNAGAEQRRLDGLVDAPEVKVEIVSLSPPDGARPGVELLAYLEPSTRSRPAADGSAAATVMLTCGGVAAQDPDGHRLEPAPSDPT